MTARVMTDQYGQGFAARWEARSSRQRRLAGEGDLLRRIIVGPGPGRALPAIACGSGFRAAHRRTVG